MSINQIPPEIIGAVIGGLLGAVGSFILGLIIFYKQLNQDRHFLWMQKIEQIFLITHKLLHRLEIILKSQNEFFLDPEKYYHREHPEGEYFENYDDYFEYKKNKNGLIFEVEFYEDFELLKSYVLMFLPIFSEDIIQIEKKILEVNPMLHVARDVDSDYFREIKQHVESINRDIDELNKQTLTLLRNKFTDKVAN